MPSANIEPETNSGMIDSSTRRPSDSQGGPRVFERPRPAVTEFSRHGSRTQVSQEYATHSGAVGTRVPRRATASERAGVRASAMGTAAAPAAAAPRSSLRSEAARREQRPVRHNATARVEAAREAKDRAAAVASTAGGFFATHKLACIIVGAALAVVVFLYGPVATYYRAWRAGLDLQAQYDALAQSNDQIQQQNDALLTREGIEEEARRRGYVGEGETGVVVEGLPDGSSSSADVTSDHPWYVAPLDVIFGYEAK